MSIGNTKDQGNKGHNMPFQLNVLKGLQRVSDNTQNVMGLLSALITATRAHQDMEILLVRDSGNADLVVQQIREYDETSDTWSTSYQDVSGATYIPIGPLVYLDPSAVLSLILAELLDMGLSLDSIAAEDFATETTLLTRLSKADFEARINTLGQKLMAASTPVVIASDQSAIPVTFGAGSAQGSRYVRTVGVAPINIPTGATEVKIMNIGSDNITVDTGLGPEILEPGISIPFRAREGRTLGAYTLQGSSASSKFIYTAVI